MNLHALMVFNAYNENQPSTEGLALYVLGSDLNIRTNFEISLKLITGSNMISNTVTIFHKVFHFEYRQLSKESFKIK